MDELKSILNELVNDLEELRVAVARRVPLTGEESRTVGETAAATNRAAYNAIRRRIDALQIGGRS